MYPISPLQTEPRDTADSKRQIPDKLTQRMNQEKNVSGTIKPLPMQNHETNFVSLIQNIFHVTTFGWQRRVGTKILDENLKLNGICLLCVQPPGGGKTLLYQVFDALLKGVCIYISPVLSIGGDQVNKLTMNTCTDDTKYRYSPLRGSTKQEGPG